MPLVSVIIPCYNLGQYLADAVSSVEGQTLNDWEIIIVDDGSTDPETRSALSSLRKSKKHKIISQKNAGPAAARNRGIKEALGEYIVCLDSDDMLAPTYLEKTINAHKDPSIGFVTTWLQEFGDRNNVWEAGEYDIAKILITNQAHAGSLFKKEVWSKAGGYNEARELQGYEDWDFWLSIVDKGYKWTVVQEPLFLYRIRKDSLLSAAKDDHFKKYSLIYDTHEKLFKHHAKELVFENTKEVRELHDVISSKNAAITDLENYKTEVLTLREELFKTRDELHTMRNSRVLGRIIKAREFVGSARKSIQSTPRRSLHKTRVVVAPLVPGPARRSIKRTAKRILKRGSTTPVNKINIPAESWPKSRPLVSVVVPYYNRADTIDDTLDSLKNQSFKNFEVIIVNDGSTEDESIDKLAKLDGKGLDLSVVNQENSGVAKARNNGITRAKGKYIICLDSDDLLTSDFIEKCTIMLEANPDLGFITTDRQDFGVINDLYKNVEFNAKELAKNNMVITAAEFRKQAWEDSGGYKSDIGYEDWEYWMSLSEKGWWGKLLAEPLFLYRTSLQSRFVEDKDVHWKNLHNLKTFHPKYISNIGQLQKQKSTEVRLTEPSQSFVNIDDPAFYAKPANTKPNILMAVPWLTFGGAETLILNFCNEIKDSYNISFVTGLPSLNEWEYKFRELSDSIYHLPNLFSEPEYYLEFVSNYIKTRGIDVLHIIHTSAFFDILPEIKKRHPKLKIITTVFNDRAEHFYRSVEYEQWIDAYSTDNNSVDRHYREALKLDKPVTVIPNGINCYEIFNPALFDRQKQRAELKIAKGDLAIFFIGRLSEEKNPDVFCDAADEIINSQKQAGCKFFIIGDGPMRPDVEKELAQINSADITYLGYQSDIARYLSAADVFVLPSSIEGFPLSILEAMAMKVACVASDVGAVAEVITDGQDGFVVRPGSVDDIVKAVTQLKAKASGLEEVKSNARKSVEAKYSNTILGTNYKKLYKSIL